MSVERKEIIEWVAQARASGARQSQACKMIGISAKTLQRWVKPDNQQDGRLIVLCERKNKLTELERQRIIKITKSPIMPNYPRVK